MDVDARLEALEAENERLRDRVDSLLEQLGRKAVFTPAEWRLTQKEATLFCTLMAREQCSKQSLMDALYQIGPDEEPEIKIIDVFVCKLRAKIKPFGLEVETIWGRGYRLSPEVKQRAASMFQLAGIAA